VALGHNDDDGAGIATETGGPDCRDQLHSETSPIKMVFVVDVSGSNVKNNNSAGSDPKKVVRGGSMNRFYSTYVAKSNFAWSLITFSNSSADTRLALTNGNASAMRSTIDDFMNLRDNGDTPYVAALEEARQAIVDDKNRSANTKYIVVFLSDGLPNPQVSDSTLNSRVQAIKDASPGAVSVNTIYYGDEDAAASERLKMMAKTGEGNFLDTNANPTGTIFSISDLVILPGVTCN
jgi:Mg-chelatase subunit ChlD